MNFNGTLMLENILNIYTLYSVKQLLYEWFDALLWKGDLSENKLSINEQKMANVFWHLFLGIYNYV